MFSLFKGLVMNLEAQTSVPTFSSMNSAKRRLRRRRLRRRRLRSQLLSKRRLWNRLSNSRSKKMGPKKLLLLKETRTISGHGSCHPVVGWVRPSGLVGILRPTLVRAVS